MVRSKGSSRAFSSVDHVTTSFTFSCLVSRSFSSLVSPREVLSSSLYVSILFFNLSLSRSLAFPLLSSVDTIESVYRRCYEYKNFVQEKKTGSMGFLSILIRLPRYFRSPVLVLLSSHKEPLVFFSIIGRCPDHL